MFLKDITNIKTGFNIRSSCIKGNKKVKIIRIKDCNDSLNTVDTTKLETEFIYSDNINNFSVKEEDIIFIIKGRRLGSYIIKKNRLDKYLTIPTSSFAIISLVTKDIKAEYLNIILNSNDILSNLKPPSIKLNFLKEININVPTIKKQNSIIREYTSISKESAILENITNKRRENLERKLGGS